MDWKRAHDNGTQQLIQPWATSDIRRIGEASRILPSRAPRRLPKNVKPPRLWSVIVMCTAICINRLKLSQMAR